MIIPSITPLPPSPQRTDPSTFAARADASLTAQETVFTPELNAFASAVNVTQGEMTVLSATATEQAQIATTQAAAAASSALSAGATVWVSGTTYTVGVSRYSPLDGQVYRRMVGGAGTTDPSLDAVNWRVVNGLTSELIVLPFNNLPASRPSLNLDFANNQALDPRITFTRASTATRTNNKGLIESVASGMPRIDYDAVTGACKGLLIEEQRANLLTYSEAMDNAYWGKSNTTVTANATTSPDGMLTADKLIEDTVNAEHYVDPGLSVTSGTVYAFSMFAKAAERSKVRLRTVVNFPDLVTNFDLAAGVVNTSTHGVGNSGIAPVGNGWYRCWVIATANGTGGGVARTQLINDAGAAVYAGTTGSGLFIWGAQLEAGAFPTTYQPSTETFTGRASTATFYGSNGLIQTASSGIARMNYNPMNLTVQPKLLLEAAGTNLLTYSEQFDNAAWVPNVGSVSPNASVSPDGLTTADRITSTGAGVYRSVSGVSASTHTVSIYAKYVSGGGLFVFGINLNPALARARFDLQTGVVSSSEANVVSALITPCGGGWFRCSVTVILTSTTTILELYNGTVGAVWDVWGAQLEAGAFPTSYIPTVASQVTRVADTSTSAQTTRAADVATMTGANFSSWYRQDEGSFVVEAVGMSNSANALNVTKGLGIYGGRLQLNTYLPTFNIVNDSSVIDSTVASGVVVNSGSVFKSVIAYKTNNASISTNGAAVAVDTSLTLPTAMAELRIGNNSVGGGQGVWIRALTYYPKFLTSAEQQALSTQ